AKAIGRDVDRIRTRGGTAGERLGHASGAVETGVGTADVAGRASVSGRCDFGNARDGSANILDRGGLGRADRDGVTIRGVAAHDRGTGDNGGVFNHSNADVRCDARVTSDGDRFGRGRRTASGDVVGGTYIR